MAGSQSLRLRLGVRVKGAFQKQIDSERLRRITELTLLTEGIQTDVELGIYVTDDATVKKLNLAYRGLDETTDVLSFALTEPMPGHESEPFIDPPDGVMRLGEVIISYPRAVKQAGEHGRTVEEEIAWLAVHGLLHLLGHDHHEPGQARRMRKLERKILTMAGKGT